MEINLKIPKDCVIVDIIYRELFTIVSAFDYIPGHVIVPRDEFLLLHEKYKQNTFVLCFGHRNIYGAASLICKKCKRYHPSRRFEKPMFRMEAILFDIKKRKCTAFVAK